MNHAVISTGRSVDSDDLTVKNSLKFTVLIAATSQPKACMQKVAIVLPT